jgi:hypothetical protein
MAKRSRFPEGMIERKASAHVGVSPLRAFHPGFGRDDEIGGGESRFLAALGMTARKARGRANL